MAPRTLSAYHCSQQQERRARLKHAGMLPPLQAIVRARTPLDGAGVQRAWEKVAAAYPVLAVRIGQVPGEDGPLQIVGDEAAGFYEEPGLLPGSPLDIEARLRALADRERVLIDSDAPRARLALVRGSAGDDWLVITVAPECCDTSSLRLLTRQLLEACESGAAPSGEEIDYFQYAEWQHDVMREAEASELSTYWQAQLNEGVNPLSFMPRVADPHVVRAPAIAVRTAVPDAVAAGWRSLSARLAASPAHVALASVAGVLSRLNGMDALCVGWAFDGRTTPELERTVGPLDQVLPVTLRVAPDDTVASLVRRVREGVEEAADRQDFVDWSDLDRSLGDRGAIVPFSMEWLVLDAGEGPHAGHEVVDLHGGEAAYEVKLTIVERGAGIEAWWTHAPDRVDAVFVEHLSTQWLGMLPRFVADGDSALADLPVCHGTERRRLLDELAGRPVSVPGERSILDLIDEQVRSRPDAIALRGEDVCLTYAAFDRRVRRAASAMRSYVTGGLVGVDATFGPDAIVLMVAAMKAGLTCVPVDTQQPADRLAALANEDGVLLVFGTRSEPSFHTARIRYVALDETAPAVETAAVETAAVETAAVELPDVAPQAPAYVILTSGSTGTPKGVNVSHESLARSTFARLAYYREPVERFLLLSPLHVDSSVAGIYWTLACGGELLLPGDAARRDAERIGELLRSSPISHLLCIPSLYRLVLEAMRPGEPCALRTAIVAAEPCPRDLVSRHELVMPETRLYNEYGPSEGTVWASVLACQGFPYARISIGRPAPHVRVYVLDRRGETTAVGQTGEIHLGGAIASGYWNNPRETARSFVPDALSGAAGAVLYRSGDYGAWNADASLAFSGRRDDQVKILGFRVELAEVCEAIESHAAVREACVRFLPERGELVAYVVPGDEAAADVRAVLTQHVRGCLPRSMHPHHWIVLASLPTLPGGKVDTQKLPAPALESAPAATLPVPDDPLESLVAAIWQRYLPGRAIGRGDSFFAVGGNSLNGIQIVSRLQEALQTDVVSIQQLFECPVLSDFTRELQRLLAESGGSATLDEESLDADADSGEPQAPASFFQERLFFLHMLDPAGSAYNCPFAIRIEGQVDASSLQACLRQLQEKHAALRTTLRMRDGVLHQDLCAADIALRQVDLRSGDGGPSDIDALILEEGSRPFDLQGGALFRATLFTLDGNTCVLVAVVHHAVFDGWSLRILVSDFKRLYAGRHAAARPPAGAPVPTYAAYARWQRRQWDRGVWRNQLQYWTGQLRGAAGLLAVPADRPRREGQRFRGDTLHFEWPASVAERVRQACRERNITTFMFFEALLALVLHRYSGQADVLVGTPVANRRRRPTEELIGPVANTLVVRNAFAAPQTWNDLLAQVRSTIVQAYCNQDVPFEKVVEALQPVRTLAASPIFQVMFVMQNVPVEPFELEGLHCEVVPHRSRSAKFDLTLSLFDRAPEIGGQLEYDSALFDRDTMERLLRNLERALQSVLDEPHAPVDRVDVISEPEKRLLREWNPVPAPDEGLTLVSLFEAQAARAPDATAVSFDGSALSYAALDRRANQLANHLLALGVKPDTPVAVIAERSLELVISLLAILKAGCAYLPLDCDAPVARLQRIWTRAGRPHAITDTRRAQCAFLEEREICWPADAAAIAEAPTHPPGVRVDADRLAYVIYTSGSTGEPKGVMVPHRGIVNRLRWMQQELGLSAHDVILQKTPYTFDVSVWEFFWPLVEGARLALAPPGWHKDQDALQRLLRDEQVSYTHFVPSMLGAFMQFRRFEELRALRGVVCSGESLHPSLCERFFAQAQGTRLYNMYGPTEASVDVSSWACRAGEDSVPIGRPIDGAQLHVASARQAPVPLGGAGELLIGGVGLARGYWADARATARAFIPDDRSDVPGARLYRSGDLARYRRDGAVEFLGRSDGQVKLRGIRIELGEIEHALRTFEGVADVAVVAHGAGTPDARIAAYVTGIHAAASEDLRAHAATVLPSYMVPADILVLEEMPTLPSGKADRASLSSRELPRRGPLVAHVPAGDTERRLAGLWMRRLRLDEIDANASFFAAGGHSLAAIALLAELNREFGINMGLPVLLESQSFVDLAARVDGLRHLRDSRSAWSDSCASGEVEGSL